LLEFWRHVLARRDDAAFWNDVESVARNEPRADVAVGAVYFTCDAALWRIRAEETDAMVVGSFAAPVQLWIETYGRRVLLTDSPFQ